MHGSATLFKGFESAPFGLGRHCFASGGGGLTLVGADLERTGRAFEGSFAGGGEADEDSIDTAGAGVLWDFDALTTCG